MKTMKKGLVISIITGLLFFTAVGIVFAAFIGKSKYNGATFSVASADIRLLNNLALGVVDGNMSNEITGPAFDNISSSWTIDYPIKLYNNGTTALSIDSRANYETANDTGNLRSIIYVEPFVWNDSNGDGVVNEGEKGTSLGNKTITKWKTEGFDFGTINKSELKGYILTFSAPTVSDTLQGKTGMFDFEFYGESLN